MRLKNDKIIDVVDSIQIFWIKNKFRITIDYIMLNMKNDLILNENFWQNYRLCFDYDIMNVKIMNNEIEYSLYDMYSNFSRFQIFNIELSRVNYVSRRVFEKLIRKNVKCFFLLVMSKNLLKCQKKLLSFNELSSTQSWTKLWISICWIFSKTIY